MTGEATAAATVRRLARERPKSRFARWSGVALLALGLYAWATGGFLSADLVSPRRVENFRRFLSELKPFPLQGRDFSWTEAVAWIADTLSAKGFSATLGTLSISVVAIVLAAVAGGLLAPFAARSLAAAEPYLPETRVPSLARRLSWRGLTVVTRVWLIFLRAIPEYVWVFLFVAMIGPTAWPAVLALAIHNAGILGKLNAEVVENLERPTLEALRGLGSRRSQLVASGVVALTLPRFLLFFFYRWETCIRGATVVGLLGIVSLGFWIQDARARQQVDTMFLFILIGAALVLVVDLMSALARGWVRRAA